MGEGPSADSGATPTNKNIGPDRDDQLKQPHSNAKLSLHKVDLLRSPTPKLKPKHQTSMRDFIHSSDHSPRGRTKTSTTKQQLRILQERTESQVKRAEARDKTQARLRMEKPKT